MAGMADVDDVVSKTCSVDGCLGARLTSGGRCWAHADEEHLDAALKRLGNGGRLDARGTTITAELLERLLAASSQAHELPMMTNARFDRASFEGSANLEHATFVGDVGFRGATFQDAAWFRKVTFQGTADFAQATFKGPADFTQAIFMGDAWLVEASFLEEARFSGARFLGPTRFGPLHARRELHLRRTLFVQPAPFEVTAESMVFGEGLRLEGGGTLRLTISTGRALLDDAVWTPANDVGRRKPPV
jgi:hypothetical protein